MRTLEGHNEFSKIHTSRGRHYAILEKGTKIIEDSEEMIHTAKGVEITEQEKGNPSLLKAKLYRDLADPLFFKSQRGEATKEEWLEMVDKIKSFLSE